MKYAVVVLTIWLAILTALEVRRELVPPTPPVAQTLCNDALERRRQAEKGMEQPTSQVGGQMSAWELSQYGAELDADIRKYCTPS